MLSFSGPLQRYRSNLWPYPPGFSFANLAGHAHLSSPERYAVAHFVAEKNKIHSANLVAETIHSANLVADPSLLTFAAPTAGCPVQRG